MICIFTNKVTTMYILVKLQISLSRKSPLNRENNKFEEINPFERGIIYLPLQIYFRFHNNFLTKDCVQLVKYFELEELEIRQILESRGEELCDLRKKIHLDIDASLTEEEETSVEDRLSFLTPAFSEDLKVQKMKKENLCEGISRIVQICLLGRGKCQKFFRYLR